MMLVITGVGSLIVLYSTEYMEHDRDYRRFFAEMSFFLFAMLLLVEAANFFFLIVGWGLVGLASYLLIGYYYDRPSAVAAAKKAFVVNVIGDIGMVIAAFILVRELGTLDYGEVFATAPEGLGAETGVATAVALLLFVGAAAKSAQIPLHTWLPDAMEGPTPVSALIHAATMVTAGVYMIVRCNVLYELAPYAGDLVAIVGAATLLMAATIALVQVDIKRVLAWSTVSQIGYMIMGAGLGAYDSSMFHFLTHAFFKALLFLARRHRDPRAGRRAEPRPDGRPAPPPAPHPRRGAGRLPGHRRHPALLGLLQQGRDPRDRARRRHPRHRAGHRRPGRSRADGLLHVPPLLPGLLGPRARRAATRTPRTTPAWRCPPRWSCWPCSPRSAACCRSRASGTCWTTGSSRRCSPTRASSRPPAASCVVSIVSVVLALVAIGLAYWIFVADPERRLRLAGAAPGTRALLTDQYRFDEVYEEALIQPGRDLGDTLTNGVERYGVQGSMEGVVRGVIDTGRGLRVVQTGLVRSYVFAMVAGVVAVGVIFSLVMR